MVKAGTHQKEGLERLPSGHRILGIDPGSRVTGFGIIELNNKKWQWVTAGCFSLQGVTFIQRLNQLQQDLSELLQQFHPHHVAIEDVFVHKNPRSALKLGQARGVAIASIMAHGLSLYEYAPRQIKQAVVGKGGATKAQVAGMMKAILNYEEALPLDASDALAVALCHAHMHEGALGMLQSTKGLGRRRSSRRSTKWSQYDRKN